MKVIRLAAILALAGLPLPALAQDLAFQLTNQSSVTIVNFYTSPSNTNDWEEDVFGDGVLLPGYTVTINVRDGSTECVYDMKFVVDGGDSFVESGIDICNLDGGEYTLTDAN